MGTPTWLHGVAFKTQEQAIRFASECYLAEIKKAFPNCEGIHIEKYKVIEPKPDGDIDVELSYMVQTGTKAIPICAVITLQRGDWWISQATPWVTTDM